MHNVAGLQTRSVDVVPGFDSNHSTINNQWMKSAPQQTILVAGITGRFARARLRRNIAAEGTRPAYTIVMQDMIQGVAITCNRMPCLHWRSLLTLGAALSPEPTGHVLTAVHAASPMLLLNVSPETILKDNIMTLLHCGLPSRQLVQIRSCETVGGASCCCPAGHIETAMHEVFCARIFDKRIESVVICDAPRLAQL